MFFETIEQGFLKVEKLYEDAVKNKKPDLQKYKDLYDS